jgi:hypothetical protein
VIRPGPNDHRRGRWALVGCVVALAAGLTAVPSASAAEFHYCAKGVPANSWCPNEYHSLQRYTYNAARYFGGGSVLVCEKISYYQNPGSTTVYSWACGYNSISSNYDSNCGSNGCNGYVFVGNGSGTPHTINGEAHYF